MALNESLKRVLPKGSSFGTLHIHTQPRQTKHLVHHVAAHEPKITFKVKHFFSLLDSSQTILLGTEVYVYVTVFETHTDQQIFISKADTTGIKLLRALNVNVGEVIAAFLTHLLSVNVTSYSSHVRLIQQVAESKKEESNNGDRNAEAESLVVKSLYKAAASVRESPDYFKMVKDHKYKRENLLKIQQQTLSNKSTNVAIVEPVHTMISFFTRAEKQYIFPDSFRNPYKHVVDGKQLLDWWLKILNNVLGELKDRKWGCKLAIPGSDSESVKKFYQKLSSKPNVEWSNGSLYGNGFKASAIYEIPLFPDDPKGRFLEHLVVENRHKSTTSTQFWEELGIRQEFRLGNLVGIVGARGEVGTAESITPTSHKLGSFISSAVYKSIMNIMKGEDYSNKQALSIIDREVKPILRDINRTDCLEVVNGLKIPVHTTNDATQETKRLAVNNLSGLVKRKKK